MPIMPTDTTTNDTRDSMRPKPRCPCLIVLYIVALATTADTSGLCRARSAPLPCCRRALVLAALARGPCALFEPRARPIGHPRRCGGPDRHKTTGLVG